MSALRKKGIKAGLFRPITLFPLPERQIQEAAQRAKRVVVPEMNLGQLAFVLQGKYLREVVSQSKVEGQPFHETEILDRMFELVAEVLRTGKLEPLKLIKRHEERVAFVIEQQHQRVSVLGRCIVDVRSDEEIGEAIPRALPAECPGRPLLFRRLC